MAMVVGVKSLRKLVSPLSLSLSPFSYTNHTSHTSEYKLKTEMVFSFLFFSFWSKGYKDAAKAAA